MKLYFASFYTDPNANFKVSFKVFKFLKKIANENLTLRSEKYKEYTLELWYNTARIQKEIEIKGPDIDKKDKTLGYGLFLPYKKIIKSKTFLKTYLEYYFDAMAMLLSEFEVPEADVRKVQKIVMDEVLDNPEYEYKPPTGEIGLSGEELFDLLEDDELASPKTLLQRFFNKKNKKN